MFNNIGKKIKTLVMIVFVLGCVGSGIAMIVIWSKIPDISRYNAGAGVLTFFGGLLAGGVSFLFSWIGSFFLYGYGELIDSCQSMSYDIQQIKSQMTQNNPAPFLHGNTNATNASANFNTNANVSYTSAPASETTGFGSQNLNIWTCKHCGNENSGDSIFCSSCGEKK